MKLWRVGAAFLEETLQGWGYEVSDEETRLALLDWEPGLELCHQLRRRPSYVYVILLAPEREPDALLKGLEAGADDVVTLPLRLEELKARLQVGQRIVKHEKKLATERDRYRDRALHDPLTDLYNRTAIFDALERELNRAGRERAPVGVVMADVDFFKEINDLHGHLAGDEVLKEVSTRMRRSVRKYDSVGRYGGEEFLLVFPGCDRVRALMLAERIRKAVSSREVEFDSVQLRVTLSLGVSADEEGNRADALGHVRHADKALYQAKRAGRNRVEGHSVSECS
ncbi:MAG: diguanylate cyclase [Candidatus Eremiobacterota bacterium]